MKYKYSTELRRMREVTIFDPEYEEPPLSVLWWILFIGLWLINIAGFVYLIITH